MEKDINYLFAMAKQNQAFLYELTNQLMSLGRKVANSIIKKYAVYNVILDDVEDLILYLVYYVFCSYIGNPRGFERYARFVFYKRLTSAIIDKCIASSMKIDSLDDELMDGTPIIEMIPDQKPSIPDQVSLNEAKLRLASPKASDNEIERKKHKVFNLQCAGYSSREIMKILHLSEGQYRYLLKLLNEDAKIFNTK